jgi:hypothetical protein
MSGLQDHEAIELRSDAVTVRLNEILDEMAAIVADNSTVSDATRIDRIARLEKLRAATAASQVAESVRFAQSQVGERMAANVHPEAIGRGIAEQIGLACRIAPVAAARRLNIAQALWFELPDTYNRLVSGELHERIAETVVSETRHLDVKKRRAVDDQLATAGLPGMSFKAATSCVRKAAYEADREAYLQRAALSVSTAGSASALRQTPWPSSAATCQSSKASRAMQPCANKPMVWSHLEMAVPEIKSWPTRWWNASLDKPRPPT